MIVYDAQAAKERGGKKGKKKGPKGPGMTMDRTGLNYHSGSQKGLNFSSAPTTMGVANMTYRFMPSGLPNKESTHDYRFGVKVKGAELLGFDVVTFSSGTGIFASGSSLNVKQGTLGSLFATGSRVLQFATIYGYQAIRRLKLHYVPLVGTTTAGLFALGIVEDPMAAAALNTAGLTVGIVSQGESSTVNNAWLPKVALDYTYAGVKDYPTTSDTLDTFEQIQFTLTGAQAGMAVSTTFGFLFGEYEIDFYSPQSVVATVAVEKRLPLRQSERESSVQTGSLSLNSTSKGQEEQKDDRELILVERQVSSRSSSVPASARSDMRGASGSWFTKPDPLTVNR